MAHTSVKISANSSDYQSQMKSAASQMKVLSSEFKLAQTQAKAFGSAADQLKAKAESLTQKITLQKNIVQLNSEQQAKLTQKLSDQKTKQEELKTKVEAAKKAYEDSTKATGANSEQSKALKEELDKLEQEFKTNETAIGKTETALANQTTKTNASKASLVEMESELEKVNKELKNHKLNEFASGCDKAGQKMESFGKKMSVVSAGIAAIGAASIAAFKELDEGYDTIVTKTGATGEALEGLTASADNVFGSMPEDMSTVGEAIGEVNTRFHSTGEELESLSTQFIQFSSINGTNVTQSVDQVDKIMKAWNIDTSQTGNLLGLLTSKAQETGISVDKLESYVLDNNSAFKEMGLSLPQAINLMAQFDANGVDSTTALAGLKKALQNATAEGKSMDVALEETIGSIKNAKTDTEALQIATELFGKKGAAEMATAIRENRIDLTSLSSSMSEYGTTVEDTYNGTLDPIDNATIAMNNAKLALSTLATTAQTAAAPVIEKVTSNKLLSLKNDFTNKVESVKQGWSTRFTNIKDTATNLMETAKTNVSTKLENMKSAYNEKGGGMKGIVSATFTGIKDTMNSLMSTANTLTGGKLDSIKSSFSTKLNGALSTVGSVMESIRAKFSEKMESAKTAVSNAIDRIKGFFNFEWSLPHLKMPHFSISGSFSLNPPSVPSFGVEWYKTGGIMTSPTVFGMNGTRLMVGGEAGAEAILPLAEFYTELNSMLDRKLKAINQNVNAFIEVHNYIDGDEVASRTTEKVSDNLAIATKKRR